VGIAGGVWYANYKDIPGWAVRGALPAFLLELTFYVAIGFEAVRNRLAALPRAKLAAGLFASAIAPYLIAEIALGRFRWTAFAALCALTGLVIAWYFVLPARPAADLAFVALIASTFVTKAFPLLYVSGVDRLPLDALGKLMWIRLLIAVALLIRRMEGIGFGFVPRKEDWLAGTRYFLYLLAPVVPLAFALGFVSKPAPIGSKTALLAIGTFLGVLWVLAVFEEFLVRGMLQQLLTRLLASKQAGLLIASVLFGLAHLWFRAFPNWKFALLAAVAGWFYGAVYARTGTIRASMVTHALLVTTWRVFLA
jgi:membrane protease YdiL (CAAX protease family)